MANRMGSVKHLAINKANTQVIIISGIAGFLTVLCLVSAYSYVGQISYLSKVTAKKEVASKQLKDNIVALNQLSSAYDVFQAEAINKIGGTATGTGQNDGRNAKIILDALPSSYDFPALTASIEKILTDRKLKVEAITGTDDEIVQQSAASSPDPKAVPMSFTFKFKEASFVQIQDAVKAINASIRPIQVETLTIETTLTGSSLEISAHTYYQPPKNLTIKKEKVQP